MHGHIITHNAVLGECIMATTPRTVVRGTNIDSSGQSTAIAGEHTEAGANLGRAQRVWVMRALQRTQDLVATAKQAIGEGGGQLQ